MTNRYSARVFDETFQVPKSVLESLLESVRLSPSAYGALNYRVLVFPRSKTRSELNPIFGNQNNFVTASEIILFVADRWSKVESQTVDKTIDLMFPDSQDSFKKQIYANNFHQRYDGLYKNNPQLGDEWSAKQVYIALGVGLVAAESLGLDSCPLGGFDEKACTKWLQTKGLIAQDEMAVIALAIGKASPHPKKAKIRQPMAEFAKIIN